MATLQKVVQIIEAAFGSDLFGMRGEHTVPVAVPDPKAVRVIYESP
jgi:hypothetical protein